MTGLHWPGSAVDALASISLPRKFSNRSMDSELGLLGPGDITAFRYSTMRLSWTRDTALAIETSLLCDDARREGLRCTVRRDPGADHGEELARHSRGGALRGRRRGQDDDEEAVEELELAAQSVHRPGGESTIEICVGVLRSLAKRA